MNTLDRLLPGESAVVSAIEATGLLRRRIMDMGLVVGTPLKLIGMAPMGDPLEIRLRGYNLSLRQSDARCIVVEGGSL